MHFVYNNKMDDIVEKFGFHMNRNGKEITLKLEMESDETTPGQLAHALLVVLMHFCDETGLKASDEFNKALKLYKEMEFEEFIENPKLLN